MRRLVLSAALVLAPALATAQLAPAPVFATVLRTYSLAGCSTVYPDLCTASVARFGLLTNGTYALEADLSTTLGAGNYFVLDGIDITSEYRYTTAPGALGCGGRPVVDGRCSSSSIGFASHPVAGPGGPGLSGSYVDEFIALTAPRSADLATFQLTAFNLSYYVRPASSVFLPVTAVEIPTATTAPEPATLALTLGGLAVLGAVVVRRRA